MATGYRGCTTRADPGWRWLAGRALVDVRRARRLSANDVISVQRSALSFVMFSAT